MEISSEQKDTILINITAFIEHRSLSRPRIDHDGPDTPQAPESRGVFGIDDLPRRAALCCRRHPGPSRVGDPSSPGGFAALAFASPSRPPAFGFGPPAGVCSGTPLSRDHIVLGLGLLPLAGGAAGPLHLAAAAGDAQEYSAANEKGSAVVAEDKEGGVGCDWRSVADSVFESDDRPVILFDGLCNLCNGGVNFALDHDEDGEFFRSALAQRQVLGSVSIHGIW